ncbi:hypothetical protein OS493_036769 [Desmophyllum pertusum]|uniref:Uncharacterized protein n=1 Tax=Desmophyllum pertusum TaxID=174260 RepID=A0A9W9YUN9_9CNID|nr:hypothetical protein OS493_036769 [Desmophyllum pertusum]
MCRWGCLDNNMIFKCKFCGTNYCKACGRGDFHGVMTDSAVCRVCFQPKCQGERIGGAPEKSTKKAATNKKTVKTDSSKK